MPPKGLCVRSLVCLKTYLVYTSNGRRTFAPQSTKAHAFLLGFIVRSTKWLLPVTLRLNRPYEDREITLPPSSDLGSLRLPLGPPQPVGYSLRLSLVMGSNHLLHQISVNERELNPPASGRRYRAIGILMERQEFA